LKKLFHKNQLIITTLALMLAIAGYISYDRANSSPETAETNAEVLEEDYTTDNITYDISEEELSLSVASGTGETEEIALDDDADDAAAASGSVAEDDGAEEVALEETQESLTDSEEILNPGETVLTSLSVTSANYAAEVKLNREQIRSKNKEALLEIIDSESISEEQKQDALNEMVALADISEKEANAEMLLEAKGFTNVVVSISDDTCDVVVDMGDVTDAKRAQVEDIVKRKTGISAENIIITPISADATALEQ
jgi:stage III sporulation protein AH